MRCSFVLLALVAFAAAHNSPYKQRAADQDFLKKQQDVIYLLQKITQDIPNEQLQTLGNTYDIGSNYYNYDNPIIVKYYVGAVNAGLIQPKGTVYSNSISQLRKEVALLYRIFLGAKDYQTFLGTAAWARVHVNEGQFVKAFVSAVLVRPDTQGVILPPAYEIFPQYHLDSRIIKEAQVASIQGIQHQQGQDIIIPVNYSANLPHDEEQLSYFTQDVGLAAYYGYVSLTGYILAHQPHGQSYQQGPIQYQQQMTGQYQAQGGAGQDQQGVIGHGSQYYYLHQQLLARYQLNRLSNGLGPINDVDYENVEAPYQPHLRHLNGLEFPGRPENLQLEHQHQHQQKLVKYVHALEQRLHEAIDSGHVITPQGVFLSLYQPQGLNILGDLIEGTGRSVNPRYYGSFQAAASKLLGNAPNAQNIWDYTPSVLELGQTAVHDPAFYQLYKKVIHLFYKYQESLPAYQYNDLVLPGVAIQNVDITELVTLFNDYYVDLDSVTPQSSKQYQQLTGQSIKAHLKRLDHKPYEYKITVQADQAVQDAVVRVYLGPKHDYQGKPISISQYRDYFVQLDQWIQNLQQGQNVIVRHSQQASGQSYDYPSVQEIQQSVSGAIRSQEPFYITEPHQIFGFPARLSLPKGQSQGFPLQLLVVISGQGLQNVPYGPVIPEEQQTYQAQHYQIIGVDQYQPGTPIQGMQQVAEVVPEDFATGEQQIQAVRTHYANIYTKYHGQYPYTQILNPVGQGVGGIIHNVHGQQYGIGQGQHGVQGHYGVSGQYGVHGQYGQHGVQGQQYVSGQYGQQYGQTGQQYGQQQQVPQGQIVKQEQQVQGQVPVQQQGYQQYQHPIYHGAFQQGQKQPIGAQGVKYGIQGAQAGIVGGSGVQGEVHAVPVQGAAQGLLQGQYQGSIASGQVHAGGYQGVYAQPQTLQDQSVNQYYQNKPIYEVIGGAISLDGKPLGYPLDRPLSPGALYVPNIYVKDVLVYHEGQPTNAVY